jgi:hypothetical protein
LTEQYGANWSWRNSVFYSQLRGALDRSTLKNEMHLDPKQSDKSADFLSFEQFEALLDHVWVRSEDVDFPFAKRLKLKTAFFILSCISFNCLCGDCLLSKAGIYNSWRLHN